MHQRLTTRFLIFLVAATLSTSLSWSSVARSETPMHVSWVVAKKKNKTFTMKQAVKKVKRKTGGRILSADTVNRNGKNMHRIKALMPSGEVRFFYFNAK